MGVAAAAVARAAGGALFKIRFTSAGEVIAPRIIAIKAGTMLAIGAGAAPVASNRRSKFLRFGAAAIIYVS